MSSANVVTVGCRLPNGLNLDLLNYQPGGQSELLKRVTVKGINQTTRFIDSNGKALVDHAETQVEEAHWLAWAEANKESPLLKNNLVFADAKINNVKSLAKELSEEPTGFDRLKQKDLPKVMDFKQRVPGQDND